MVTGEASGGVTEERFTEGCLMRINQLSLYVSMVSMYGLVVIVSSLLHVGMSSSKMTQIKQVNT